MKGGKAMGPDGYPNQGVEMPQGHNYSMANQAVQPYFSIKQDAWRVEEKYIGIDLQE